MRFLGPFSLSLWGAGWFPESTRLWAPPHLPGRGSGAQALSSPLMGHLGVTGHQSPEMVSKLVLIRGLGVLWRLVSRPHLPGPIEWRVSGPPSQPSWSPV